MTPPVTTRAAEKKPNRPTPRSHTVKKPRSQPWTPRNIVLAATVIVIGYLVIVPLYYLLWGAFFNANGFSLGGFARAYLGDSNTLTMVFNSLVYAFGSTVLALVAGTLLAYVNVRTDAPLRGLTFVSSLVPLIIPAILYAPAWVFLASPTIGVLNAPLRALGAPITLDIYSLGGMVWVQGLHLSPIVFLFMAAAFRAVDPSGEESALVSGVGRIRVWWSITLPLTRPAMVAAALLIFVMSLESFEIPAIIGLQDSIYVLTTRMYFLLQQYPVDLAAAGALAVGLLIVAAIGIVFSNLLGKNTGRYQTVTGKSFRPRPVRLRRARPFVGAGVAVYFLVTVVAPVGMLLYVSLLGYYRGPSLDALRSVTLQNFRTVFEMPLVLDSFKNTLLLGVGSATAVMILSTIAAWFVVRTKAAGRQIVDQLTFAPLVIPGMVLGLALLFVYLRFPLPVYGTLLILLIAYTTRFLPFGMRYASAAMYQVSSELEESAYVSGATWGQSLRRVLLPLTSSGIVAGWIYVLMVSFRELSATILLYSPGTQTLSVLIFTQYRDGRLTVLAAIGVLMIAMLVVLVFLAYKIGARFGVSIEP